MSSHKNRVSTSAATNLEQKRAPSNRGDSSQPGRAIAGVIERFSGLRFEYLASCTRKAILSMWVGVSPIGGRCSQTMVRVHTSWVVSMEYGKPDGQDMGETNFRPNGRHCNK